MIIKNLRKYLYFNLFRKYIFIIIRTRISSLEIIIKILILYIRKILLYIIRVITIISTIYIKKNLKKNSIIKIIKLISNLSQFFIILL